MSKKQLPNLYSKLLYKMGHYFLDTQYEVISSSDSLGLRVACLQSLHRPRRKYRVEQKWYRHSGLSANQAVFYLPIYIPPSLNLKVYQSIYLSTHCQSRQIHQTGQPNYTRSLLLHYTGFFQAYTVVPERIYISERENIQYYIKQVTTLWTHGILYLFPFRLKPGCEMKVRQNL